MKKQKPGRSQNRPPLEIAAASESVAERITTDSEYCDALKRLLSLISEPKRDMLIEFIVNNKIV